jgi:hypothetical protein
MYTPSGFLTLGYAFRLPLNEVSFVLIIFKKGVPMNAQTLKALKGSIRKWRGIVAGTIKDKGSENCPLCKVFLDRGCEGCPVNQAENREGCCGTPYGERC